MFSLKQLSNTSGVDVNAMFKNLEPIVQTHALLARHLETAIFGSEPTDATKLMTDVAYAFCNLAPYLKQ